MEKLSCRDDLLLGCISPRKLSGDSNSSPKIPITNPDMNFNDVFGGPPRSSSVHEMRHSLGDTLDSYAFVGEEALIPRNPWTGLSEKPVFGEEGLIGRRRYTSEDFFDDIFRGKESSSSTIRRPGRDLFSSTPASRIASPARPLTPKSLPRQLSLPPKLAKGMDLLTTCRSPCTKKDGVLDAVFPSPPSAFMSRVSNQVIQGQDDLRNGAQSLNHRSPLSHEFALSSGRSSKATYSDNADTGGNWKKDSSSSEVHNNGNEFHFFMYKWASKRVRLLMPFRGGNNSSSKEKGNNVSSSSSKERNKNESIVSKLSASALQGVEFPSPNERMLLVNSSSHMKCENQSNSSILNTVYEDRTDSFRFVEEAAPDKLDSKPLNSLQSTVTDAPRSFALHSGGKEIKPFSGDSDSSPGIRFSGATEKVIHASIQEASKPKAKPLRSLLQNDSDREEKDRMARQAGGKEGAVKSINTSYGNIDDSKQIEKQDGKRNIFNLASSATSQGSPIISGDKLVGNKVKGKVKEFIKIFNQDTSSKPIVNVGAQGHSSRRKDIDACKAEDGACVCADKENGEDNMTGVKKDKTLTNTYAMVDQILKQPKKPHFVRNTTTHQIKDTSSERNINSASRSETIPTSFKAALANVEESRCEDLQGKCLVEALSYDQNKQQQTAGHHEEIRISDAKIQQWSNGKEMNIRSLLSTLQYVLWPESGWKPVPLVDIIEGNAVKRAYQKALLCLHPDKLQQKGAALHQKYIAEKVFDILQEAWTHFNSLGSV